MVPFPTDVRSPQFLTQLTLYSNQNQQAAANLKTHDEYVQYSTSWVAANTKNIQQGLPVTPPKPVPLQTIYNDDGSISHPPFPDLSLPAVNMADVTPAVQQPGFGGTLSPNASSDALTGITLMLQHVIAELDAIKAKVGA